MILKPNNPALVQAITIHPKAVRSPTDVTLLKSVSSNKKLGGGSNVISKGKWSGMPMFQLTLQERATCMPSCPRWDSCYGNNMAFAHRIDHTHPEFIEILGSEINALAKRYRHGFVIRPHVLGEYFNAEYAAFWIEQTALYPNLRIFGFTHWPRDSVIGRMIHEWNKNDRVWVRFSDQGGDMSANVEGEGFPCPEQLGLTQSCLTCGACWSTTRAVSFKQH